MIVVFKEFIPLLHDRIQMKFSYALLCLLSHLLSLTFMFYQVDDFLGQGIDVAVFGQ